MPIDLMTYLKPKKVNLLDYMKPKEEAPESEDLEWMRLVGETVSKPLTAISGALSLAKQGKVGEQIGAVGGKVGEAVGEAVLPSYHEITPETKASLERVGERVPKQSGVIKGVRSATKGLIRAPFGIASWKADLVTNPKKAISDMGQMLRNGLATPEQIYDAVKEDGEARKQLIFELENQPVEKAFEVFMPLAMLLGVRKLGKGVSKAATDAAYQPFAAKVMQTPEKTHVLEAKPVAKLEDYVSPEIKAKMEKIAEQPSSETVGVGKPEGREVNIPASPEAIRKVYDIENELRTKKIDAFDIGSRRMNSRNKHLDNPDVTKASGASVESYVFHLEQKLSAANEAAIAKQAQEAGAKRIEMGGGMGFIAKTPEWLPAKIKSVVKSIHEPTKKLFQSMGKRGKTGPYKILSEEIRDVDASRGVREGGFYEAFRDTGFWQLERTFRNQSKELGTYLLNETMPTDPKLRSVAEGYYKIMDDIAGQLEDAGIKVLTPEGKLAPFKKTANYFPRIMKPDIAGALFEDANNLIRAVEGSSALREKIISEGISSEGSVALISQLDQLLAKKMMGSTEFQRAVNYRVERGFAKSPGQAVYQIWNRSANDLYRPFANVERSRVSEMPMDFYNNDAQQVVATYIHGAARAISEVERWGADREGLAARLAEITMADPTEGKAAMQMVSQFMGTAERLSPELQKWAERFVNFEVATKIGLGTATIPNTTQLLISTAAKMGWTNAVKATTSLLTKEGRKSVREAGLMDYDVFRIYYGEDVSTASITRGVANITTTASLFNAVNQFNRAASAQMVRYKLPHLYKWASEGGGFTKGRQQTYARNTLKEWGVDWNVPLTEAVTKKAMYRVASESQLQRNVVQEPGWMTNPKTKVFGLFKRFQYKQIKWTKDNIIKEAANNPLPLLRLIAGGAVGGEVVIQAKELVRSLLSGEDRERQDKIVLDEETLEAANSIIRRAANDLAAAGTMGLLSEFFDAFDPYKEDGPSDNTKTDMQVAGEIAQETLDKLKFVVEPVMLSEIEKAYGLGKSISSYVQRGYTLKETGSLVGSKAASMAGSLPGYVSKRLLRDSRENAYLDKAIRTDDKPTALRRLRQWIKADDIDMAIDAINRWNDVHTGTERIKLEWIRQVQREEKKKERENKVAGGQHGG